MVVILLHFFIEVFQNLVALLLIMLCVTEFQANKYLKEGDIINIDVTAIVNGWHGDTSRMFFVGDVSVKSKNLVSATYDSMMKAISIIKNGITFRRYW